MKIAFITAGAAGMYCGSCLRDNALARALIARGHDVLLVPTYTPTRTDEPNVSHTRVFLGGINVFLQHKSAFFRHTPWLADRLLDSPRLLNWASRFAVTTDAADLGSLTVSMLQGEEGPDRKEFQKLVTWLADEFRPEIVDLSNGLLLGLAGPLRQRLGVPVVCTLSGEDLFVDGLSDPWRAQVLELMRRCVADVDAFVTFSRYYADHMSELLHIPKEKLFQVPLGISLEGHGEATGRVHANSRNKRLPGEFHIGYLARICPEKGLHVLAEAFRMLHEQPKYARCHLRVAGYLGERDRPYLGAIVQQMDELGLREMFHYLGEPDLAGKIRFLQSLDVFSVPTIYREAKGLPVLEAWANRIPVVQPSHGSFTELVNATQGGVLVPPDDPPALAAALAQLLDNEPLRHELGQRGRTAVELNHSADRMAEATVGVYERLRRNH